MPQVPATALVPIVDKSASSLVLLRDIVEETGMTATILDDATVDAEQLLDFVVSHEPDVVLYDIPYAYEANLEEFHAIRADPRSHVSAWVALSTSSSVVKRMKEGGECAILGKPFDPPELLAAIEQELRDLHDNAGRID